MPVTTVPNPCIENVRSIGSRVAPPSRGRVTCVDASRSAARRSSSPAPVRADTEITGACSRNDPATSSRTSRRTSSNVSSSTRSDLVRTTMPCSTCRRRQMSKCSRVCGITDSSAATIRSTQSSPPTPASIVFTNRSWPGTSTNATVSPSSTVWAKPSSIVMPRSFSSLSRSGSIPVSACTSALLPWSMCPAVPTTMCICDSSSAAVPGSREDSDHLLPPGPFTSAWTLLFLPRGLLDLPALLGRAFALIRLRPGLAAGRASPPHRRPRRRGCLPVRDRSGGARGPRERPAP